ncbi:MAG: hypothetical protein WCS99_03425, partial [Limisphaerales bacterium]
QTPVPLRGRAALEPTVESNRSAIATSIRPEAFSLHAAFFFFPSKDRISGAVREYAPPERSPEKNLVALSHPVRLRL